MTTLYEYNTPSLCFGNETWVMRKRKNGKETEVEQLKFLGLLLAVNLREWIALEKIRDLMQTENLVEANKY
jgi:hypothetical protein